MKKGRVLRSIKGSVLPAHRSFSEGGSEVEGFTLIEILVVVTIIVMLTVGGIVSYSRLSKDSRDAARKTDLENIRGALEMYRSNHDVYPITSAFESELTSATDTYIKSIPDDPKGDTYQIYNNGYSALPAGCDNIATMCTSYSLTYTLESLAVGATYTANPYGLQ